MSRHRAQPPPRPGSAGPDNRHRATQARPRYGRLAVAGTAVAVTAIALLGGVGVLPSVASGDGSPSAGGSVHQPAAAADLQLRLSSKTAASSSSTPNSTPTTTPTSTPTGTPPSPSISLQASASNSPSGSGSAATAPALPADSGSGKRVVFSQGQQRVWLVEDDGSVADSYLVSGSLYDNLAPGQYSVYSRSEDAVGVDDSGTMKYFVRFAHGPTGAAIGFHDIPIFDGSLVQTRAQLGTPESHGCVRQYRPDAIELWNFAPVGTEVDVTAA